MLSEMKDYDIVGGYDKQNVIQLNAERSINMFPYVDPLGKKPKALINTSGLLNSNLSFSGADDGFRAQFVFEAVGSAETYHYFIIGNTVWRQNSPSAASQIGTILNSDSGYVGVCANSYQVLFVDGFDGYIYDTISEVFEPITDSSFPEFPLDCSYLDGFFVVASGGTNAFRLSQFNQGLIWGIGSNHFTTNFAVNSNLTIGVSTVTSGVSGSANFQTGVPVTVSNSGGSLPTPLAASTPYYAIRVSGTQIQLATTSQNAFAGNFIAITGNGSGTQTIANAGQLQEGTITSDTGNIVACRTLHRRLFLFSNFFTEVWENQGLGTNLPFRRNNSLLLMFGTPCLGSIDVGFDKMNFIAQDRNGIAGVVSVNGVEAVHVSNRALDNQLGIYAANNQISDCRAFFIKEQGLIFYRMNFTEANHTFVYNMTLSNPESEDGKLWHEEEVLNGDRHPAQTHAYFNGLNYVGDYQTPLLYILSFTTYQNNGENIRRARIGRPQVPGAYQRTRIDRFQLDILQGVMNLTSSTRQGTPIDINLLTQDLIPILTEDGDNIILEQKIYTPTKPVVFLSVSKDGGTLYGAKIPQNMGAYGDRTARTLWRKSGVIPRGQAFVPLIEFFENGPFIILGASWSYEVLPQ